MGDKPICVCEDCGILSLVEFLLLNYKEVYYHFVLCTVGSKVTF